MPNLVFYDFETCSSNVSFGQIIQAAAVLVNDDFQEQAIQVKKILTESGFELSEKTHAEMHDHSTKYSKTAILGKGAMIYAMLL